MWPLRTESGPSTRGSGREGVETGGVNTELPYETCRELLGSAVVGRVAICTPTGPTIVPVNFAVQGESLVIRTSPYSALGTYGPNARLAFEIDHLDHEYHTGWSVVAVGRAEVVSSSAELDQVRLEADPQPWAGGNRHLYLRLAWDDLTGRKIGAGWPHGQSPVKRVL